MNPLARDKRAGVLGCENLIYRTPVRSDCPDRAAAPPPGFAHQDDEPRRLVSSRGRTSKDCEPRARPRMKSPPLEGLRSMKRFEAARRHLSGFARGRTTARGAFVPAPPISSVAEPGASSIAARAQASDQLRNRQRPAPRGQQPSPTRPPATSPNRFAPPAMSPLVCGPAFGTFAVGAASLRASRTKLPAPALKMYRGPTCVSWALAGHRRDSCTAADLCPPGESPFCYGGSRGPKCTRQFSSS